MHGCMCIFMYEFANQRNEVLNIDNYKINPIEVKSPVKTKKYNYKSIVILSSILILSLISNVVLALFQYRHTKAYDVLINNYNAKSSSLNLTEYQLKQITSENKELKTALNQAIELLSQYDKEYKKLQQQDATSKIPKDYYISSGSGGSATYGNLKDFLNYKFYLPENYKLGIFDCSESAAYLEYVLQNNSFDAKIAIGPTPWDETGYHAWVLVTTSEGMVAIEPTSLTGGIDRLFDSFSNIVNNTARGVVYYNNNDQISKNYYEKYTAVFEDITEAVKNDIDIEEWNWWEGFWGFK